MTPLDEAAVDLMLRMHPDVPKHAARALVEAWSTIDALEMWFAPQLEQLEKQWAAARRDPAYIQWRIQQLDQQRKQQREHARQARIQGRRR